MSNIRLGDSDHIHYNHICTRKNLIVEADELYFYS